MSVPFVPLQISYPSLPALVILYKTEFLLNCHVQKGMDYVYLGALYV